MMHVRTKFREPPYFCDPVGPSFSSAKVWIIDWLGTRLTFRAPKHYPRFKMKKAICPEKRYRDWPEVIFRKVKFASSVENRWEKVNLFFHDWAFNGPWFSGSVGSLTMSLGIYKHKGPGPDISCFHPRVFEQMVADYLLDQYSGNKTDEQYHYQAPVNWQIKGDLNVAAARFEALCDGSVAEYSKSEYVFLPLNNQHMAVFFFKVNRNAWGNAEEMEKQIGYSNFGALIDDIIGSIEVTLSSEIEARQDKALTGLENATLVKTFPPLKWNLSKDDVSVSEKHRLSES